jgi:hypothetical protein
LPRSAAEARALVAGGRFELALPAFRNALSSGGRPRAAGLRDFVGLLIEKGRFDDAVTALAEVSGLSPSADLEAATGELAARLVADDAGPSALLGRLAAGGGQPPVPALRAVVLGALHASAAALLDRREAGGDPDFERRASRLLQAILTVDPDDAWARNQLETLHPPLPPPPPPPPPEASPWRPPPGNLEQQVLATAAPGPAQRWTVRGVGLFAKTDGDVDRETTLNRLGATTLSAGSGAGLGLEVERRLGDRCGLAVGLAYARLDLEAEVETGGHRRWDRKSAGFVALTAGPTFHLSSRHRADAYLGPLIGVARLDDVDFQLVGEAARFDFNPTLVWGVQAGVDVPFGTTRAWAFHGGVRYVDVSFKPRRSATVEFDPVVFSLGIARRF